MTQDEFRQIKYEFTQLKREIKSSVYDQLEEMKKRERRTDNIIIELEKVISETLNLYITTMMESQKFNQDFQKKMQNLTFRIQLHSGEPQRRNQAALGLAYSNDRDDIDLLTRLSNDPDEDNDLRLAAKTALKILQMRLKNSKETALLTSLAQTTKDIPVTDT